VLSLNIDYRAIFPISRLLDTKPCKSRDIAQIPGISCTSLAISAYWGKTSAKRPRCGAEATLGALPSVDLLVAGFRFVKNLAQMAGPVQTNSDP